MVHESKKHIIVINSSKKALTHILQSTSTDVPIVWVYFGRNVPHFLEIKKMIGIRGKNIPISDLLQVNAGKYRQDFIDYLGACAVDSNDPWWYLSSISEKNPDVSDLYLNFCYLKTFFDLISIHNEPFFVICESTYLIWAIRDNISDKHDVEIRLFQTILDNGLNNIRPVLRKIINKSVFFVRFALRISLAKIIRVFHSNPQEKLFRNPIVIHSWADSRSFFLHDHYSDVYFGDLVKKIDELHEEYFFLIDILPTLFYPLALNKIIHIQKPWHLFEEYLKLTDIVTSLITTSKIRQSMCPHTIISGVDIFALIREAAFLDRQNTRAELSYLYYAAGKRISRLYNPKSFFYTFENHIWEKMFIKGIREISGGIRIIGYAHSTVNSMYLSYSLSDTEKKIIPLPDNILVNGKKPKQVLIESGFDKERLYIIGSLRYGSLYSTKRNELVSGNKRILVILSINIDRSLEMISKVWEAFRDCDGVSVIFKPHPVQKNSQIIKYTQRLPKQFSISSESLSTLLNDINMAIFSDSTASIEAAARGIPILHIKSDFLIDINIFERSKIVHSVSDPEQIRSNAIELCQLRGGQLNEYQDLIWEFFSPIDEKALETKITLDEES